MLLKTIISAVIIFVLLIGSNVSAQSAPSSAKLLSLHAGMQAADVEKSFGAADAKSLKQGTGRESWYYGGAVIFFLEGSVTAWSDDGSLLERQTMSQFQSDSEADVLYEGGWLNAWTPQEPLSRTIVLNELIQSLGSN